MTTQVRYKVIFSQNDAIYEIFAKEISESDMFGFLEVEELVFDETSSIIIDPTTDKLKKEFANVKRTIIPMYAILRIDEVAKEGVAVKHEDVNIKPRSNVHKFPRLPLEYETTEN